MRFTGRVRSFTLIELLIVISIIVILMGLLLTALATVPDMVRRGQAKAMIKQLCTVIDEYKSKYGNYPPDGTGTGDEQALDEGNGYMLEHIDGDGYLPYTEAADAQKTKAFINIRPDMIGAPGGAVAGTYAKKRRMEDWAPEDQPELLDPWGRPYQYVRNVDDHGDPVAEFSRREQFQQYPDPREYQGIITPQKKSSYDLWSFGKDPNDPDAAIANWLD